MSKTAKSAPYLSRRVLLAVALLGVIAVVAWGLFWPRPSYSGAVLGVAEVHEQASTGALILIDIRRPDEWTKTGVATTAVPIDMRRDDFLVALTDVAGIDRSQPIALICARGVRSARLSVALTEAGFTHIIDVPEGMLGSPAGPGWLKAGLPTHAYKENSG